MNRPETLNLRQDRISKSERGFTLVETLVAVAILMIAIAGPLSIANQALTAALNARDQSVASFLAQEEMEIVKNIRDNNLVADPTGTNWLVVPGVSSLASCTGPSLSSSACGVSVSGNSLVIQNCTDQCQIYSDPNLNVYSYSSSGNQKTLFTRYFYLSNPGNPNAVCSSSEECQVNVVVSWSEGTVPNAVTLSSEIVNHLR